MENYEIMFIVKPTLEESVINDTVKSLESIITGMKGKVTTKDMGKREELLIAAVYMADLYGMKFNADALRNYISRNIKSNYKWY